MHIITILKPTRVIIPGAKILGSPLVLTIKPNGDIFLRPENRRKAPRINAVDVFYRALHCHIIVHSKLARSYIRPYHRKKKVVVTKAQFKTMWDKARAADEKALTES